MIEPVMSAAEWASPQDVIDGYIDLELGIVDVTLGAPGESRDARREKGALIALLNASLPDDDPRKITREKIIELSGAVAAAERDGVYDKEYAWIREFLSALESYLPPE